MTKETFNFENFLSENGYEKEVINDGNGEVYAIIYQKEVAEKRWNAITFHNNGKITASSHYGVLEFLDADIPTKENTAREILKAIEKV
ncbi:hypothetical protein ACFFUE_07160 [Bergeyella porcorum]|uniref:hypothetical protein n=1 Tax=Bergeyella porcorum TaxID=1735111 RepID=UPI0035EC3343